MLAAMERTTSLTKSCVILRYLKTVDWWYHWLMGGAGSVDHAVALHKNDDGRDYEWKMKGRMKLVRFMEMDGAG